MKKVLSLFIACLMVVGVFSVAVAEAPKSLKIAVICSAAGRNDNG